MFAVATIRTSTWTAADDSLMMIAFAAHLESSREFIIKNPCSTFLQDRNRGPICVAMPEKSDLFWNLLNHEIEFTEFLLN